MALITLRKGTKKAIIVLTVAIVLILATTSIYTAMEWINFENKVNFTAEEIESTTYKVFKKTMGFGCGVKLFFWGDGKGGPIKDNPIFLNLDPALLTPKSFYIYVEGGGGLFQSHYKPNEITAAFECLVYFKGKKLDGDLIGIVNYQSIGGIDNYRGNRSFISVTEFEQLCAEVDTEGLSRRKAAEKLAERWIEKHNYVKK